MVKHGQTIKGKKSKLYRRWQKMRERCNNKNHENYQYYGGRGIKVCKRWDIFENFLQDMGQIPFENFQLDRIDVDGDYEPNNCRWVNPSENAKNKRSSIKNRHKYIYAEKDKLCADCLHKLKNVEKIK